MAEVKKITNEELFEELKSRGFWVMSDTRNPIDHIVVSIKKPNERILFNHDPNWDNKNRGSGSC